MQCNIAFYHGFYTLLGEAILEAYKRNRFQIITVIEKLSVKNHCTLGREPAKYESCHHNPILLTCTLGCTPVIYHIIQTFNCAVGNDKVQNYSFILFFIHNLLCLSVYREVVTSNSFDLLFTKCPDYYYIQKVSSWKKNKQNV